MLALRNHITEFSLARFTTPSGVVRAQHAYFYKRLLEREGARAAPPPPPVTY